MVAPCLGMFPSFFPGWRYAKEGTRSTYWILLVAITPRPNGGSGRNISMQGLDGHVFKPLDKVRPAWIVNWPDGL